MKKWIKKKAFTLMISLTFFLAFLFQNYFESKESYYSYIFLYLAISFCSNLLPNSIVFKQIKIILSIPLSILFLIGPLLQVFIYILTAFIIPSMVITLIIKYLPEEIFEIDIKYPTKLYIILVLSTIFTTLFGENLLYRVSNIFDYDKTEESKKSHIELALTLVNSARIKFFIYSGFFIYLIIFSISKLGDYIIFDKPMIDNAIFYSFVTYIAFERVVSNSGLMNFNPLTFIQKLIKTWENEEFFKNKDSERKSL